MIYLKALTLMLLLIVAFPSIVVCTVCLFLAQRIMK